MSLQEKLFPLKARHEELSALMAQGDLNGDEYSKYSKEYAELDPIIAAIDRFQNALQERDDAQELLKDPDMKDMAQDEIHALNKEIDVLEQKIKTALIPKDSADTKSAILEIRPGTGGEEAALFAQELFEMYKGYASFMNWKVEILELSASDLGGVKEIIIEINGYGVFAKLKYESGVHRVQRVPKTESGGRIHTSAATVAVLAEAEDVDIDINDSDLRIDTFRAQGAGGQHVNKTDSAVRITHLPTGLAVAIQDEKSQHKNKAKAMKILRSRLLDQERQKQADEMAAERKSQVGSGDRSERIRTYNYPQGRVTDHRINLTIYKLTEILAGEGLPEIIDSLQAEEYAEKLAELEGT